MRFLATSLLCLTSLAHAADVTELPPALRGDVRIGYGGQFFRGPLMEDGERVVGTRQQRHSVSVDLAFAVTNGLAVTAALDTVPSYRIGFTDDGRTMAYDPVENSGTYEGGNALTDPPEITAGGLSGLWLGVAAGPYGRWQERDDPYSWRFDVAARIPTGRTLYEGADDKRGVAPGSTGFRLAGAFATEQGFAEPYLRIAYQYEARAVVDIGDPVNGVTAPDATIQAPSTLDVRAGSELIFFQDREAGRRFALDLYLTTGYRTQSRGGSGVFLPSVIPQSRSIVVHTAEHLVGGGGLGLFLQPNKYVGVRVGADFTAYTPYRVEHPYSVYQGAGTHQVGVNAALIGHWR